MNLLDTFLHETTENYITIGLRPWYYVSLIVGAMSHHVLGDLWSSCEENLSPCRIGFRVLDPFQHAGTVSGAVENDLRR